MRRSEKYRKQSTENRAQRRGGRNLKLVMRKIIFLFSVLCFLFSAMGCEALVRKFTRKPKEQKAEELVLFPQDYKDDMTAEQRYRQYFLFWKSWQEELITSLLEKRSLKKKLDCIGQAIKNLEELRSLINNEEKQKLLGKYIQQSAQLKNMISNDTYGNNADTHREKADVIKRNIARYFSYSEVKAFVK